MFIRVNKRDAVWGFGSLWLTYEDKRPLSVDFDKLDSATILAIKTGLATRTLYEVDKDDNVIGIESISRQVVPAAPVPTVEREVNPVLARKARELLDLGVAKIRKELAGIRNRQMLDYAIEYEVKNKNRKTVLNMLREHLAKYVAGSLQTTGAYDNLVTEEEIDTIKINISEMCVVSEASGTQEIEEDKLEVTEE